MQFAFGKNWASYAKTIGDRENQDFTMWVGDDLDLRVTVKDDSGEVVNLTGFTIEWRCGSSHRGGRHRIIRVGHHGGQ